MRALEEAAGAAGVRLKPLDRKAERAALQTERAALQAQLAAEQDPATRAVPGRAPACHAGRRDETLARQSSPM